MQCAAMIAFTLVTATAALAQAPPNPTAICMGAEPDRAISAVHAAIARSGSAPIQIAVGFGGACASAAVAVTSVNAIIAAHCITSPVRARRSVERKTNRRGEIARAVGRDQASEPKLCRLRGAPRRL